MWVFFFFALLWVIRVFGVCACCVVVVRARLGCVRVLPPLLLFVHVPLLLSCKSCRVSAACTCATHEGGRRSSSLRKGLGQRRTEVCTSQQAARSHTE